MIRSAVILALLAAVASAASHPEPDKAESIRELVRITGGDRLATLTMEQMVARARRERPQVPAEFWEQFLAKVNKDELIETIVPIYDRHFSHEEIRALLAFYRGPVGQKLVAKTPAITHETTLAGYDWGRRLADRAAAEIEAQGRE